MDRYSNVNIIIDSESGNRRLATTFITPIPISAGDIYIISDRTTRLDLLADKYYHDKTAWPIIATCNNLGKGTLYTGESIQIRIPNPVLVDTYIQMIKKTNISR